VKEADRCVASGKRGELEGLMRWEGIYSSHLSNWRALLGAHGSTGLTAKKAGRKPKFTEAERLQPDYPGFFATLLFSTSCFIRAGASAHSAGVIVAMGSNMRRTKASGPPSARACSKAAESRFLTRAKDAAGRSMNASG
jgi:hypothetical protein